MKATGAARGVVAVENNKKDSITLLTSLLPQYPGIEVMPLKGEVSARGRKVTH